MKVGETQKSTGEAPRGIGRNTDNLFDTKGFDGVSGQLLSAPGAPEVDRLFGFTAPRTYGVEFQYRFR